MEKVQIQANLSIDRSGGADKLPIVIDGVQKELEKAFPGADIAVRKGFFQTIDGIWSSKPEYESKIQNIVAEVRRKVLA